jgi:hypothetical protein
VCIDGGFVTAEFHPWEQGKAKVDRGGGERVQGLIQIHGDGIIPVERPRDANESLSEIREDTPVMSVVGVGQIAAGDLPAKAHVVRLAAD